MQAGSGPQLLDFDLTRAWEMEQVIVEIRRHWFGACPEPRDGAVAVVEPGGELLMFVDADPEQVEPLLADSALRGVYVVATSFSRPADLGARLRRHGFRSVQRHNAYVLDEQALRAWVLEKSAPPPERRGMLSMFRRRPLEVAVAQVGPEELPVWNSVCWRSFGARGTEEASMQEKRYAFHNMGGAARWFLALVDGHPAGTAILYQSANAAQVMAVGTLPRFRGRGVAGALMLQLIRHWLQDGTGFLFLDTEPGSIAERLYRRIGFRQLYQREVHAPSPRVP